MPANSGASGMKRIETISCVFTLETRSMKAASSSMGRSVNTLSSTAGTIVGSSCTRTTGSACSARASSTQRWRFMRSKSWEPCRERA